MWAEFGQFSLCLALAASVVVVVSSLWRDVESANQAARSAIIAQAAALSLAFGCLVVAFVVSDFSVTLVASNSHSEKPLLYKVAGTWGNHEGSMLLWMLVLSIYGAGFARFERGGAEVSRIELRVLGMISLAIILFILLASNPFLRMDMIPVDGKGLNPLLQDPGLAIHPPILYAGYVGFAIPYAMAIGAILRGCADRHWASRALPWVLTPLAFLSLGVGLGSWWAYRELGWGGFWFWDPVENASLLPWLLGVALAHGAMVLKRTGALGKSTLILAVLTFSLSILGTFLVRSGVLTSVHSFAVDPKRGALIFIFLVFVFVGGMGPFFLKSKTESKSMAWDLTSRAGFMTAGVVVLLTIAGTVLVGTLYPLALDAVGGEPITVGAPYFNATARPLGWLLVGVMVLASFTLWSGPLRLENLRVEQKGAVVCLLLAMATIPLTLSHFKAGLNEAVMFSVSVFLCGLIVTFAVRNGRRTFSSAAMILAHGGIALSALGMTGAAFFSSETIVSVDEGEKFHSAGRVLLFEGVERGKGVNYLYDRAKVSVLNAGGQHDKRLLPERRWYPAGNMTTSEAVIARTILSDFYVTLGDLRTPGAKDADWALRVYYRPFISWVWLGCIFTFLGVGFGSINYFRLRGRKLKSTENVLAKSKESDCKLLASAAK